MVFEPPAAFEGIVTQESDWVMLAVPQDAQIGLSGRGTERWTEHARATTTVPLAQTQGDQSAPIDQGTRAVNTRTLATAPGWLVVVARGQFEMSLNGTSHLESYRDWSQIRDAWLGNPPAYLLPGPAQAWFQSGLVTEARDAAFELRGQATEIALHGAVWACGCLHDSHAETEMAGGQEVARYGFNELDGDFDFRVVGAGRILASSQGLGLEGQARLPLATLGECHAECAAPSTIRLAGRMELRNLTFEAGLVRGNLEGFDVVVQVDEGSPGWLEPQTFAAATVGFTIFALALISKQLLAKPLHHPQRRLIHDTVAARRGITFRALQRATAVANGQLNYHLFVMESAGIIRSERFGRNRVVMEPETHPVEAHLAVVLADDSMRRIAAHIRTKQPDLGDLVQSELDHGVSRSTTLGRVRKLQEGGWVEPHGNGLAWVGPPPEIA